MSKVIDLGCSVSDIHRRYAEIHGALFGITSYRLILFSLKGKTDSLYSDYEERLNTLQNELKGLLEQINRVEEDDLPLRNAAGLHQTLIDYTETLNQAISQLRSICGCLKRDEADYRSTNEGGQSKFNQDKVDYDYTIRELERIGTKLNKLFSSY
ncbi:MAG: hypothetical protein JAY67_15780 [Candidatus Thiodiazotropha taylori]|nr:hypothetical protein [Candidatus Thiodiazotropha taylori]RLW55671.1 MAG: hypothetical protein B6D76_02880 [gamma proteobacterium symbiont of Stewartia floridana]MCG7869721.1 hypothetical protein [Candidatus Thiodiazotropha taylori]MCG7926980.1 hypothetical protein [Candidatus Thiodiazotropha taylori]MCG7933421.1 hypothetical protein [Candidatus Thiodiazotropha taylori]